MLFSTPGALEQSVDSGYDGADIWRGEPYVMIVPRFGLKR
jgi:hypothetical protein